MKDVETDNTVGNTQFQWLSVDLMKEINWLFNWFRKKKKNSQTKFYDTTILHETTELVYKG